MSLPSHVGDGVAEATLAEAQCRCQVMQAMVLPSLTDDGAIEATLVVV
jgi:hypothetical protein